MLKVDVPMNTNSLKTCIMDHGYVNMVLNANI